MIDAGVDDHAYSADDDDGVDVDNDVNADDIANDGHDADDHVDHVDDAGDDDDDGI